MTKTSDNIASMLAKRMENYSAIGSFLYVNEPITMLRGYALDMPPGGCYIWKYYFPLFGNVDFLHMSLGYRIENGFIPTTGKSKADIVENIMQILNEQKPFCQLESIDDLVDFARGERISPAVRSELFSTLRHYKNYAEMASDSYRNAKRLGINL